MDDQNQNQQQPAGDPGQQPASVPPMEEPTAPTAPEAPVEPVQTPEPTTTPEPMPTGGDQTPPAAPGNDTNQQVG